jgi:hypothetical protein
VSILATLIVLFLAWDTPAKIPANEPGASARSAAISFYSRLR